MPVVPPVSFGVVDVRDVADIHLRAMTHPAAAGERFLASRGEAISFLQLAQILAKHLGDAAAKVPTEELTAEQVREAARSNPALRDSVNRLGKIPSCTLTRPATYSGGHP